jgi:hypothetical protein
VEASTVVVFGVAFLIGFQPHAGAAAWVTPVIETLRALLLDQPVGDSAWLALTWCGGILIGSIALAAMFFRRRTA